MNIELAAPTQTQVDAGGAKRRSPQPAALAGLSPPAGLIIHASRPRAGFRLGRPAKQSGGGEMPRDSGDSWAQPAGSQRPCSPRLADICSRRAKVERAEPSWLRAGRAELAGELKTASPLGVQVCVSVGRAANGDRRNGCGRLACQVPRDLDRQTSFAAAAVAAAAAAEAAAAAAATPTPPSSSELN